MSQARTPTEAELHSQASSLGIHFDESLPVSARWVEIAQAMAEHPVIILCGETGSGKTTQLPKIALALGRGQKGKTIAHTQPRRLAATSVARRIAQELNSPLGEGPEARVGYTIRFQDRSRPGIPIRLMTDGILLAETQSDPLLSRYDTIILDEAHERSLNIDFLMGFLHGLLPRRPDLRLVITSATLDAEKFAQHFAQGGRPAPVIQVSGRLYPVALRWQPPSDPNQDLIDRVVAAVSTVLEEPLPAGTPQDLLVFLPGEREIRATADGLSDLQQQQARRRGQTPAQDPRGFDVLPLFGRLSQADQEKIFRGSGRRRVVLSTNLAETSLTVPGIGVVIDTGLARVKRYRVKGKVEQLQIEPISQAQAAQRSGRAGRLGPGIAVRLYDEADFLARPLHPDPEIHRASLASVILQMKALGLQDIAAFPFVDPPQKRAISDGLALLRELGALDAQGQITSKGRLLAALPLDPRFARMLVEAKGRGCLREMLVIVSALSIQDPRDRPLEQQQAADQAHRRFADERSEFLGWVRLWDWIHALFESGQSRRQIDQQLRAAFLSPIRAREWRDVHRQLHDWVLAHQWRENEQPADYRSLHISLLTGLLSNIGCRIDEPGKAEGSSKSNQKGAGPRNALWQGAHDVKFAVWPGSSLAKKPPRWLMAAEQVETSRLFARTIAGIEPEWVESIAGDLIRVSHGEPHWEKKAGRAVSQSRGTLYGLTIFAQRRVAWAGLGPAQAAEARQMLIRSGLVAGEMDCRLPFFARNQKLIAEVQRMEEKARRQDLLVDDSLIEAFYDQALPAEVVDRDALEAWVREASRSQPDLLCLRKDDLMRHEAAGITTDQFPRQMAMSPGGLQLALDYRFKPGERDDGLQVTVPVSGLFQVDQTRLDWLVPGMRKEKVQLLIKSLPQRHRRHCLPLAEYAEGFCQRWADRAGSLPLMRALAEDIAAETGIVVGIEEFKRESLPPHLTPLYRVVDEHGRQLGLGRDLATLQASLGQQAEAALVPEIADQAPSRDWTFGSIADPLALQQAGQRVAAFPALEDLGDGVRLCVADHAEKARSITRKGLTRLYAFQLKEPLRSLERDLAKDRSLALGWSALGMPDRLFEQLSGRAIRRAFLNDAWPTDAERFQASLAAGRPRLLLLAQEMVRWLSQVLAEAQGVQRRITELKAHPVVAKDLQQQLQRLLPKDLLESLPEERARHLPRYLKAMSLRLDKLRQDPARDQQRMTELLSVDQPFWRWAQGHRSAWPDEMVEFRWQLEELRVQLFAQELRTPQPVSSKRLQKRWEQLALQRMTGL